MFIAFVPFQNSVKNRILKYRNNRLNNSLSLISACEPGFYGYRCEEECGDCLEGTVCLPGNGTCPKGCNEPGFRIYSDRCNYNRECIFWGVMKFSSIATIGTYLIELTSCINIRFNEKLGVSLMPP